MVGVDGSDRSVEALRWATREAERWDDTLQVVMTWDSPYPNMWLPSEPRGQDHLTALRRQLTGIVHAVLGDPPPPGTETTVADGPPAKVLVGLSGGADMLVVGNRGRGGFSGALLGSVSRQCVLHAACPVVVVRGPWPTGTGPRDRSETSGKGAPRPPGEPTGEPTPTRRTTPA